MTDNRLVFYDEDSSTLKYDTGNATAVPLGSGTIPTGGTTGQALQGVF